LSAGELFPNENDHSEFDSFIYTALPGIGTIPGVPGKAFVIIKVEDIERYQ
jgi:hypothetical protein